MLTVGGQGSQGYHAGIPGVLPSPVTRALRMASALLGSHCAGSSANTRKGRAP